MYEFKHHSTGDHIPRGNFDFRKLEKLAFVFFAECPRFMTLMLHVNLLETSPIHCFRASDRKVLDFFVPKQEICLRLSEDGIRFSVVRVFCEKNVGFWLVVCEQNRQGFLLPSYVLNNFANPVRLRRKKSYKTIYKHRQKM